mmetsp:Transcript_15086/g.32736  ORF Transcript_15086/g.32736 Transcript_15086/m.32736 type:complete len:255 (-) Transcript_15086:1366-2130(-)
MVVPIFLEDAVSAAVLVLSLLGVSTSMSSPPLLDDADPFFFICKSLPDNVASFLFLLAKDALSEASKLGPLTETIVPSSPVAMTITSSPKRNHPLAKDMASFWELVTPPTPMPLQSFGGFSLPEPETALPPTPAPVALAKPALLKPAEPAPTATPLISSPKLFNVPNTSFIPLPPLPPTPLPFLVLIRPLYTSSNLMHLPLTSCNPSLTAVTSCLYLFKCPMKCILTKEATLSTRSISFFAKFNSARVLETVLR